MLIKLPLKAYKTKQPDESYQQARKSDDDEKFTHPLGSINDYTISTRLGKGKYSNVFKGHRIGKGRDGELCVIKVLKPVRISKINREIKILEDLRNGPNISQIVDVVQDSDTKSIAIILDWSENVNIKKTFDRITTKDIAFYVYKVLQALEFAHSKGIMHRDIKPGNIMYSPEQKTVRVIDWGLADYYVQGTNYPYRVATRHYKGPELLLNYQKYNCSLDIWCLGCTLASLLFQRVPFFRGNDNDDQIIKMGEIFGGNAIISYAENYNLNLSPKVLAELSRFPRKSWEPYYTKKNKKNITPEAIDLLSKMLTIDHNKRPTASEALKHPFFDIIKDEV